MRNDRTAMEDAESLDFKQDSAVGSSLHSSAQQVLTDRLQEQDAKEKRQQKKLRKKLKQ